jgi:hypothetical protein
MGHAASCQWGVGERFVDSALAGELAGEDNDFVDEHRAGVEVGERGQLGSTELAGISRTEEPAHCLFCTC